MNARQSSAAILFVLASFAGAQSLSDLEVKSKSQSKDFSQTLVIEGEIRAGVEKLIESDSLQTAADFRRAGLIQQGANSHKQATLSTGYQLLLTAVCMGDEEAASKLGAAWDGLLMATGRYRRIGAVKQEMKVGTGDQWWVDPAPEAILKVYANPAEARKVAASSKDNPEVQKIVDEDQKVRQGDWSKLTPAQIKEMIASDRARFSRIKQITAAGGLRTAQDFWNAALVCQHGEVFLDYAFAHELSVCSLILGNKAASWLAGASYDRMLLSASYPQAFATQYFWNWHLQEFSTDGVNDRMRKAVVHLTLAESQDREKHPPH